MDDIFSDRTSCNRETLERLSLLAQNVESLDQKLSVQKSFFLENHQDNDILEQTALGKKLEMLKRTILKKNMLVQNLQQDIETNNRNQLKLGMKTEILAERVEGFKQEFAKRETLLNVYKELLTVRKRSLIAELRKIFPVQTIQPSNKECVCSPYYTIRGIHFPSISMYQGHKEFIVSSALGLIVHFLKTLGDILDYNFRNPVHHNSSNSTIYQSSIDKLIPLYKSGWRNDKERLDSAFSLLNQNVLQLGMDTGLFLPSENIAASIFEWTNAFLKNSKPFDVCRPNRSIFSPASLMKEEDLDCADKTPGETLPASTEARGYRSE
ncbi:unnamed protein product [Auanema sp. JU1783]|nr:unnamed protein product [Auanema sp. JU1783]